MTLDLEAFKDINERFGHRAGDRLIAAIGAAIPGRLPDGGLAARFAGDEFALLVPGADRDIAASIARDVVAAIEGASVSAMPANAHSKVSASFGIACYPEDGEDAEALTAHAEREMYEAKSRALAPRIASAERRSQEVFFAIGEAVRRTLDPAQVVGNFCDAVGRTLTLDSCGVWFIKDDGVIRMMSSYIGDRRWLERSDEFRPVPPITRAEAEASALLRPHPVYIDDAASSEVLPERYRRLMYPGTWMICVPIPGTQGVLVLAAAHGRCAPLETGLVLAIARLAGAALTNAEAYQRAERRGEQLSALAGLGGLLFEQGDFEQRLDAVVRRIVDVTGYDSITLDTEDPTGTYPFFRAFHGRMPDGSDFDQDAAALWRGLRPALTEPSVREFLESIDEPIVMRDPANEVPAAYREVIAGAGIRMTVVVPVNWRGELKGMLYFSSYTENAFESHDIAMMQTIAAQLAPAIQVAMLHVQLEDSYAELKDAHLHALLRLAYAAEARDPYTECHLQRIRRIAQAIGERLGMRDDELEALGYGAVVHDLGKLRIPDSILLNPGRLSDQEWELMKRHPEWGAEIIGENPFYDVARTVALHHHERWDGSGYPRGLRGENIPLPARIVSVADVYDALTSARPYKASWPTERALVELLRMRGTTLCPRSVDAFMELWREGIISRIDEETAEDTMELDFRQLYAA